MAESNPDRSTSPSERQDGRRLDSWKEIAAYLNRDVTTVRRWERQEGLPVHRHRHSASGSVYAFTDEIDAWQVGREHPVQRQEPSPSRGQIPRLVGRDDELRRLHQHLGRALEGTRETVFVAGELGIGKSALIQAFLGQVTSDLWVVRGQCVEQYGKGEPYLPLIEGIERIVRDPEAIRVVRDYAPSWLSQFSFRSRVPTRSHREVEPRPGQMAGELTAAIEMLAAVKPLILLLEDLHWSDQATVEFVARLARRPDRTRLLVIGTYRPAELFESGSPLLRVGRELRVHFQAHEIELSPLTEKAVGELIARERTWADLGGTASSLRRWSGNPLYLIHFLDHLETSGRIVERDGEWHLALDGQGLIIPSSLRMLIEEHVDRLEPDYRRVLEIASAVGETFPAAIVAQVLPRAVTLVEQSFEDLCRRSHLVTRRGDAQLPDGTFSASYAFVHEFYRQVVYERLPAATVTELHRRIGTGLESAYGTHAGDISSELALHFDRGQDFSRAVKHYSTTADNALARNADREAHIALSKATELVIQLPGGDDVRRLEHHLRAQLGAVLERLAQNVKWLSEDTGQEIAWTRSGFENPELIDALIQLSHFHAVSGDLEAATKIGDRAVAIGLARGHALLAALAQQAFVRLLAGDFTGCRSSGLRAMAVADRDSVGATNRDRTRCSVVLAWSAWYLGRYDELRSISERVLSLADREWRAANVSSMVPLLELLGDTDRSLDLIRSSRGSGWRAGALDAPWSTEAVHGWLLARRRRIAQGVGMLQAHAVRLRTLAMDSWLPYTLVWLAESLQRGTQVDEAMGAIDEGLGIVRRTGARCCDAELYRVRGEAILARERRPVAHPATEASLSRHRDSAEASFWAAISVARQQDARTLELRATLSLGRLLRDAGRQEEAIRVLEPVCELFGTATGTPDLAEARTLLES